MTNFNQKSAEKLNRTQEDEISFLELFSLAWKGKWIIIGVTFLFAIASVAIALSLPNVYKSTALVKPVENEGRNSLGALASQFGGLASLAGLNLNSGGVPDSVIAVEIMKSWGFIEDFIIKHDLAVPLMAVKNWDKQSGTLLLDESLYDQASKKWIRTNLSGKMAEPTSWELYKVFKENISFSNDKETGLVSISVSYLSPAIAKQWVDWLVQDINKYMKDKALIEAEESISYLESQLNHTSVAEIRMVFSELIQEQHKTKMLAQVSDEYVFKTISEARVPEERESPNRVLICILGTLLGGMLSTFFVLLIGLIRKAN